MKLEKRERFLLLVAGVLAVLVALRLGVGSSGPAIAEMPPSGSRSTQGTREP